MQPTPTHAFLCVLYNLYCYTLLGDYICEFTFVHIHTLYTYQWGGYPVDTKEPGCRNNRAGIYELQNQIYIFIYYMYYLAILNSIHLYRV